MKEEEIRKRDVFNSYLALVDKDVKDFFDFNSFEPLSCPACHSTDLTDEFIKQGFRYVSCDRCTTLFVNPRPSYEMLNRFYSDSPSTSFWIDEFFKPVEDVRREKIFKPRAEFVNGIIGNQSNLLIGDIGAGFGLFLEEMRKVNPDNRYLAIEPSFQMAEICRNKEIDTINLCLEEIESDLFFDILTAFELTEHLHDPEGFFNKIYALLKPGGKTFITTLNGNGFDILILGDHSKSVSPPHHLNFFNPYSIRVLLERVGFDIIEIATPGKLDWDIIEGMITKEGYNAGKLWEFVAKQTNDDCKQELQAWISKNNISSHMRVIARKPLTVE